MHAPVNRNNLQEVQPIKLFNVDLSGANLQSDDVLFYTSVNTDPTVKEFSSAALRNCSSSSISATIRPGRRCFRSS
jgi:hypothetical protein